MNENIIGVVLAGGQSRRFGSPKAFAKKDGQAFYLHAISALQSVTEKCSLSRMNNL